MEGSMVGYRIYHIGAEGRFVGVHEIFAASDADAMLQARNFLDGSDLEVWRGDEKIGYLGPDEPKSHCSNILTDKPSPTGTTSEIA
jgi:hypothetical protein